MRFVDRAEELRELATLRALSQKKLFVVVLYGLRRVGKTRLLSEFLGGDGLYFFVNKNKSSAELLKEYQDVLKAGKLLGGLESIKSWDQFFETLAERAKAPVVFDEFQNFFSVEPSVFGALQKTVDLNEDQPGLFILSGSLTSLMKNVFQDSKEPLYGRIKKSMRLEPLSLESCLGLRKDLRLEKEDLVKLYGVFGGYPKYYVAVEDFGLQGKTAEEIVEALFLAKNAPLEDEVTTILSQEFGGRSRVYYSILEAIASGNNTLSAMAGYLNMPATSITRQISELKDYFELVQLERPFVGKRGEYTIRPPVMRFWFSLFHKNSSDYASRNPQFVAGVKRNLNNFFSRAFEQAATEFLAKKLGFVNARRQWGRIAGAEKGRNAYEIDLLAEDASKNVYAFEFKWSHVKQPAREMEALKQKLAFVPAPVENARLGLVAKKIKDKQKLRKKGFLAFDLDDM